MIKIAAMVACVYVVGLFLEHQHTVPAMFVAMFMIYFIAPSFSCCQKK